jgi:hypothetical protein
MQPRQSTSRPSPCCEDRDLGGILGRAARGGRPLQRRRHRPGGGSGHEDDEEGQEGTTAAAAWCQHQNAAAGSGQRGLRSAAGARRPRSVTKTTAGSGWAGRRGGTNGEARAADGLASAGARGGGMRRDPPKPCVRVARASRAGAAPARLPPRAETEPPARTRADEARGPPAAPARAMAPLTHRPRRAKRRGPSARHAGRALAARRARLRAARPQLRRCHARQDRAVARGAALHGSGGAGLRTDCVRAPRRSAARRQRCRAQARRRARGTTARPARARHDGATDERTRARRAAAASLRLGARRRCAGPAVAARRARRPRARCAAAESNCLALSVLTWRAPYQFQRLSGSRKIARKRGMTTGSRFNVS